MFNKGMCNLSSFLNLYSKCFIFKYCNQDPIFLVLSGTKKLKCVICMRMLLQGFTLFRILDKANTHLHIQNKLLQLNCYLYLYG